MAFAAAARSVLRSSSLRTAGKRVASGASTAHLPRPARTSAVRFLRSPVEMSAAVETLCPMHSVTASALMTSKLYGSRRGYGWLLEGKDETR